MSLCKSSSMPFAMMLAVAVVLTIGGCARDTTPPPTTVNIDLVASSDVNPDRNDRPSPILVRVYELRSAGVFQGADFFSLLEQDSSVLGADQVSRWEYQLEPGQQERLIFTAQQGSGHVAVVAAYRDIEHARWRAVQALDANQANDLNIRVERSEVAIRRQ
jgi:type VI secretion system protein VasD